jgi:diguanylate cyclase (GGDEF)-like protein
MALLLVLLGIRTIRRSMPGLRGIEHLRGFILCGLIALLLLALRSRAPAFFTVITANVLLFAGAVLLYCAAAEILEVRPRLLPWAIGICATAVFPLVWFTYVHNNEVGRLETHCAAMGAVFAMTAVVLFRKARTALTDPARACGWLMVAFVVQNAAWGSYGLAGHPNGNFLRPDAVDAAFSYLNMILAVANVIALTWFAVCVHREELKAAAQTDSLTGLLNRGAFEEILRREMQRRERAANPMGLMLVDVDFFKQVNDSHGHLVGDDVLRRIGVSLRAGIRPSDVLARFGGEEFVILLRDAGREAAVEVAERLRGDIAALDDLPFGVTLTASFGVAANLPEETADDLLKRADAALYRSKREGRNLVRVDRAVRLHKGLHSVPHQA